MQYQWKYFINLSGQMFPLHTNAELVQILKLYNGANDIEGTYKRYVQEKKLTIAFKTPSCTLINTDRVRNSGGGLLT